MNFQIKIDKKTYDFEVETYQPETKIYFKNQLVEFDFENLYENLYSLILAGRQYLLWLEPQKNGGYQIVLNQEMLNITVEDERQKLRKAFRTTQQGNPGTTEIRAPMPGLVTELEVEPDQHVRAGDGLVVVEAMKMENEIKSPVDGVITQIKVKKGDAIEKDMLLIEITNSVD